VGRFTNYLPDQDPSPVPTLIPCLPIVEDDDILLSIFFAIVLSSEFSVSRSLNSAAPRRLICFFYLVIFLYSMWIAFMKFRQARSGLLKVFARDGVFYFLALAGASLPTLLTALLTEGVCWWV